MSELFDVRSLHAYYGKAHIVQGISLQVARGEAVGLVGRNGVGKTTTLKSIMGLVRHVEGNVTLNGESLVRRPAHVRARKGLGYVPEERSVFPNMSVEENIRIGALLHENVVKQRFLDLAYNLFPILRERHRQLAGTLSGGQQKMLGLARGLAAQPALLLVDEPSEGLMPINVELVTDAIVRSTDAGLSVLLVDASFDLLRRACARLYVMDRGVLVGTYRPEEFRSPDELAVAYLGAGLGVGI